MLNAAPHRRYTMPAVKRSFSSLLPPLTVAGLIALSAGLLLSLTWRGAPEENSRKATTALTEGMRRTEPLSPLPRSVEVDTSKAALGERLFHDPILSRDHTISCASCHPLNQGGTDRRARSIGVAGAVGTINTPTVLNSAFNVVQFWDGRAATLEEQVSGPLTNPLEMASSWMDVIARLTADRDYHERFNLLYPAGITPATVADALAQFERTLITPDAPFDRYLRGEHDAIGEDAREGYQRFKDYGCASCHQGINIGGNMFQRFGVMGDYFAARQRAVEDADLGRFTVTGREEDRHVFKVPSLRNIALTAPYFHDGSAATLDEAVVVMAWYQLGRELSVEDRRVLIAFLNSLTGQLRGEAIR